MMMTGVTAATAAPSPEPAETGPAQAADGGTSQFGTVAVYYACQQAETSREELACNVLLNVAGVSKYAALASLVGGPYGWAASFLISA